MKKYFLILLVIIFGCKKNENPAPLQISSCKCLGIDDDNHKKIKISTINELIDALKTVSEPTSFLLVDGTYDISNVYIYISKPDIIIRSESGNRDKVILKGKGMSASGMGNGISIAASNCAVADITIRDVQNHGIQIHGEKNVENCHISNVHFIDINEQMIKISKDNSGAKANGGIIECCLFEFSKGIANQYYTGGVDGHNCHYYYVRHNVFKHIRSPESNLCEHAVHFWSESSNVYVENNLIINCDRGIGFGLGSSGVNTGFIFNNMVHTSRDVGIVLESASNIKIYHNTLHTDSYPNSIEYRFSESKNNKIINNLVNAAVKQRDNGEADVENNHTYENFTIFKNSLEYNYRLKTAHKDIADMAVSLDEVKTDFDCENRPKGGKPDIGADEF